MTSRTYTLGKMANKMGPNFVESFSIYSYKFLVVFAYWDEFQNRRSNDIFSGSPALMATKTYVTTFNPSAPTGIRSGVFWSMIPATSGPLKYPALVPAQGSTPPDAVPMDPALVFPTFGVEAAASTNGNANDQAVRFTGDDNSCLSISGSAAEDACLRDPSQCNLDSGSGVTGLSVAMWINLPQSFDQSARYLLDTGGDDQGHTGVQMTFQGSIDGRRYSEQITVLVSTGTMYWKVVLNGMTTAYSWNNLAFRWSAQSWTDGVPYGLQVFVNGTSVAWKRSGYSAPTAQQTSTLQMTIGCKLDGTLGVKGRFDNVGAWYWRLLDTDSNLKPTPGVGDSETSYFLGGLGFTPATYAYLGKMTAPAPGPIVVPGSGPDNWDPWLYTWEKNQRQGMDDTAFLDDVSPAIEGDCLPENPSSWTGNSHPIQCADTRQELQNAITYSDTYSGVDLVKALVRVVNKNKLSDTDVAYLIMVAETNLMYKIVNTTTAIDGGTGSQYGWMAYFVSKLTESQFDDMWSISSGVGASILSRDLDQLLMAVANRLVVKDSSYAESNGTMVQFMKTRKSVMSSGVYVPDYSATVTDSQGNVIPVYSFPIDRADSWGKVTDYISLPVGALDGWGDTDISVLVKIYNRLSTLFPPTLDSRVTGTGVKDATFFVNSRIISLTMYPGMNEMNDSSYLNTFPVKFVVQHTTRQPEAPYKKGAILCAYWQYNQIDPTKLGAWDTGSCMLISTNDTHTTCACSHMTDYAILMEDHEPTSGVGEGAYIFAYVLYAISLICLIFFIFVILANNRLHYELHIISMNVAFAMIFAIIFYLSALSAKNSRTSCMAVSIFIHYSYTAAYAWCTILSHYVFRAITSGKLGGILNYYCLFGWGFPALIVAILGGIDITRYGIGERCLGAQNNYFLWVYIGTFIVFCVAVCPLFVISLINLSKSNVKDPEDRDDTKKALIGIAAYWPIIMLVWIMAILVYLVPQDTQIPDYLFELFNSLQGICIFLLLGILIPSFRQNMPCFKRRAPVVMDSAGDDWIARRRKLYIQYFS